MRSEDLPDHNLKLPRKKPKPPEPQKHLWFDGWMSANGSALKGLIEATTKFISHHEEHTGTRIRKRRPVDQAVHLRSIDALVCALAHAVLVPPPTGRIAVKLGHAGKGQSRYDSPVFGKALSPLVHLLSDLDFLNLKRSTLRGEVSSIAPSPWFAQKVGEFGVQLADFGRHQDEEVISLTCNAKRYSGWADDRIGTLYREPIDYNDTPTTTKYRAELRTLNEFLKKAEIDFLDDGLEPRVDPFDRRMRRRFIILPDQQVRFNQGGRLFGGFWQQLKRERRSHIRINAEPVVVLDYGSMFTRLAYAVIGKEPPDGDLYAIPGYEGYRSGIKLAMNALLFDKSPRRSKWPKEIGIGVGDDEDAKMDRRGSAAQYEARLPTGSTVKKVRDATLSVHPHLSKAWGRQLGYQLMFLESEIMVEVLRQLANRRIPALGLHDGLLVSSSKATEAAGVMREVGREKSGLLLPVTQNEPEEE
ncbi:MAG: hypothetical protein AB7E81_17715 [Hyphomicrobiaceae bacterium]